MPKPLSDDEMFGTSSGAPKGLTDDEMFGPPKRAPYTPVESAAIGGLQGVTLGFAPQIEGAVRGGYNALTSDQPVTGANVLDQYRKARDAAKLREQQAQGDNPKSYLAGNLAGTVGTGFVPGLGVLNAGREAGLAAKLASAAGTGAVGGAGYSDADLTKGEFGKFNKDVGAGALTGAVTQGALSGLGTALGSYKPMEAIESLAEKTPVFKGDKVPDLKLYDKFANSLPFGLEKTAKFIAPVVAPPIDAILSQGAVKAASTLVNTLNSEGAQSFAKMAQPLVDAARNGNTTAAATMYLIEKQHPGITQSLGSKGAQQ